MKALEVRNKQLSFTQRPMPLVGAGQLLVKINAIGINRADLLQVAGKYPPPKGESDIPGLEVSGEVVELGEGVTDFSVGESVFGLVAGGGYAEYVVIHAGHAIKKPNRLSDEEAASIAETFLTVCQAFFIVGNLQQGGNVFIHAGASGIGSAAIQLAKAFNCQVTVSVSSQAKADYCAQLGADNTIVYTKQDVLATASSFSNTGYDFVLDVVAGNMLNTNVELLARDGEIVVLAMLSGRYCEQFDIAKLLLKRGSVKASTLRNRSDQYKTELVSLFKQRCLPLFEQQVLKPTVHQVAAWQDMKQLHEVMAHNQNLGKLVAHI
ncbi:NAD(P)H-quinone oxidoreductase [Thalassotalea agarivorans]|nr:NAD(P)H-quinone oxidoreductase [Thalassotalea agarivorans]